MKQPTDTLSTKNFFSSLMQGIWGFVRDAFVGFWNDNCYDKAAILTFYTIQSIIPLLAAVLGFGQGFGLDLYIKEWIVETFSEQKEILGYLLKLANALLVHIKSGLIAGLGVFFLLWAGLNLATAIEVAFSEIWHAKKPRGFFRRFKDFVAAIIICPFIFTVSSSITVYLQTQLSSLSGPTWYQSIGAFGMFLLKFIPFVLTCILFFLLYYLIPRVKMRIWPRIIGALFAGIMFQLWQWFYIHFQMKIWSYSATYGTLAIIPLFLIWLQFSWLIALIGAEVASTLEHGTFYRGRKGLGHTNISRKELALLIVYKCIERWHKGESPLQLREISGITQIPIDGLIKLIHKLENAGLISLVSVGEDENGEGYQPGCDPVTVTIKNLIDIIDDDPYKIKVISSPDTAKVCKIMRELDQSSKELPSNIPVYHLLEEH